MTSASDWSELERRVRGKVAGEFVLTRGLIPLNAMIVATPPSKVRDAIAAHRSGLDENPEGYVFEIPVKGGPIRAVERTLHVAARASDYLGLNKYLNGKGLTGASVIAQTTGTTMGLALLANGIKAKPGQEVILSVHDFFSWRQSWQLRCDRSGLKYREIRLYKDPATLVADDIVRNVEDQIREKTRVLALSWVHSGNGVKLPIRRIGELVRDVNSGRAPSDRILFCVDGVHGFGVESTDFLDLHCDFLVSGCHKWLFGPRGTGIVCALPDAWSQVTPTIPTFISGEGPGTDHTPGGVLAYEHAWAVGEAFDFHLHVGKADVERYTHGLCDHLKRGLATAGAHVATPMSEELSSGIVCCTIKDVKPSVIKKQLRDDDKILATTVHADGTDYLRFSPSILNTKSDIDKTLKALRTICTS